VALRGGGRSQAARRHPRLFRDLQSRCARGAEPEQLYARLKLAGLDDAPCQLGVFADHATAQGGGLGRPTMPETLDYSVAIAIHTLWFAARAEGLGVGWVSIVDPARVAEILSVPEGWTFIGYLCIGYPLADDDIPVLERESWEHRHAPSEMMLYR